jgi:RNA polymerase sigma-70 factor (ECF subfamily)
VAQVSPDKGRFRSFLLASMNHFLADEWDKARAQKRGGGRVVVLDPQSAEASLSLPPADNFTPEKAYERRWALTLLEQVYGRIEGEYANHGKAELFGALRGVLTHAGESARYAELARQLGMSEGGVKVAVHRLRRRYRELLRAAIADTVSTPGEVDDELGYLMRTLAGE